MEEESESGQEAYYSRLRVSEDFPEELVFKW